MRSANGAKPCVSRNVYSSRRPPVDEQVEELEGTTQSATYYPSRNCNTVIDKIFVMLEANVSCRLKAVERSCSLLKARCSAEADHSEAGSARYTFRHMLSWPLPTDRTATPAVFDCASWNWSSQDRCRCSAHSCLKWQACMKPVSSHTDVALRPPISHSTPSAQLLLVRVHTIYVPLLVLCK
jgi:hypothetical protein